MKKYYFQTVAQVAEALRDRATVYAEVAGYVYIVMNTPKESQDYVLVEYNTGIAAGFVEKAICVQEVDKCYTTIEEPQDDILRHIRHLERQLTNLVGTPGKCNTPRGRKSLRGICQAISFWCDELDKINAL